MLNSTVTYKAQLLFKIQVTRHVEMSRYRGNHLRCLRWKGQARWSQYMVTCERLVCFVESVRRAAGIMGSLVCQCGMMPSHSWFKHMLLRASPEATPVGIGTVDVCLRHVASFASTLRRPKATPYTSIKSVVEEIVLLQITTTDSSDLTFDSTTLSVDPPRWEKKAISTMRSRSRI